MMPLRRTSPKGAIEAAAVAARAAAPDAQPFDPSGISGLLDQAKDMGCTVSDALAIAQLLAEAAGRGAGV